MTTKPMLIMVAGHNYNTHCERSHKRGGKVLGTTRYEELCQRRLESLLRYPKELGYPNLKQGSKVKAIVLRFSGSDPAEESAGRQIVMQEFSVGKKTVVPAVTDTSWLAYPGAEKLTGMQGDDYFWNNKVKRNKCFDRTKANTKEIDATRISVLHLYWLIHQQRLEWVTGAANKTKIFEISIFSHSYHEGPVLTNTIREDKYKKRLTRDPKDRDARVDADFVTKALEGDIFTEMVLDQTSLSSFFNKSISKYDKVNTVFTESTKTSDMLAIEAEPKLINSSEWQPFASNATLRIWGCNVVTANQVTIEAWVKAKHNPEFGYDNFMLKPGINNLSAESRRYRKLRLAYDRLWKKLGVEEKMNAIINDFPTKPSSGNKKVTADQYQAWASKAATTLSGGIAAIAIRGIVKAIRLEVYQKKKDPAWKSYEDVAIELVAPVALKRFKKCVTPKDRKKKISGHLDALVSAFAIREMALDRREFGFSAAIAFGINTHFAPPGAEGLYQEQRVWPKLKGIKKSYPVHEVPLGVKDGKRYRKFRYRFINPRTKTQSRYAAEYGSLHEFYNGFWGMDYDDDGYLVLTPNQARYYFLSFD